MAFLAGGLLIGAVEQWQIKSVELQIKYLKENGLFPECDIARQMRERRERQVQRAKEIEKDMEASFKRIEECYSRRSLRPTIKSSDT